MTAGLGYVEPDEIHIIYVKSFMVTGEGNQSEELPEEDRGIMSESDEIETAGKIPEGPAKKFINQTHGEDISSAEVYISNPNNNKSSYNKKSNTESNLIVSDDMGYDRDEVSAIQAYANLIRENIDFDSLMIVYPTQKDLLQGIYELILETVLCQNERILIASSWYPAELVRGKFLKLNYSHIQYAIDCLRKNTTKVKNIKKYLLAVLFNAPSTMDGYYTAEVNHDMPQLAL